VTLMRKLAKGKIISHGKIVEGASY
jgi:hypothetical protein